MCACDQAWIYTCTCIIIYFNHILVGELQPKYMLYTTKGHRCEVYERIVTENEVRIYIYIYTHVHVYTCTCTCKCDMVHVHVTWYMYIHVCTTCIDH